MNRPDPNSADQSANKDDDAVWLDLVARLEGTGTSAGRGARRRPVTLDPAPGDAGGPQRGPTRPSRISIPWDCPRRPPEPAAECRRAFREVPAARSGPRDFEVGDEDDDAFVPEEPPSLAGHGAVDHAGVGGCSGRTHRPALHRNVLAVRSPCCDPGHCCSFRGVGGVPHHAASAGKE